MNVLSVGDRIMDTPIVCRVLCTYRNDHVLTQERKQFYFPFSRGIFQEKSVLVI